MWDHPDSLIFVAAGNDGDTGTENGVGTVGTPATHKNGVSVGASLNSIDSFKAYNLISFLGQQGEYDDRSLASFSSRGPTKDGRLKPEVCGVGKFTQRTSPSVTSILSGYYVTGAGSSSSSSQTCETTVERGTSFACPLLAGSATLVREYFISGYYTTGTRNPHHGFTPSGALLKAVLIHGTSSLKYIQHDDGSTETTSIGDNNQGYGRVQLNRVLSFGVNSSLNGVTLFVKGAASSSSEHYAEITSVSSPHTYTFRTQDHDDLDPIRVTLVYTVCCSFFDSSSRTILLFLPHLRS
jgi:hypothetical protein